MHLPLSSHVAVQGKRNCWWATYPEVKRSEEDELLLSKEKPLCEREFELHFIFCVPDWWPTRWMMFCSAVWHCLIPASTKRGNTYHLGLMYRARGQGLSEWWRGSVRVGGGGEKKKKQKRDGDGLMTVEADGERHLPWQRSQNLHPQMTRRTDTEREPEEREKMGQKKKERVERVCFAISALMRLWKGVVRWLERDGCVVKVCVGLLAALWLASRWPRFVELGLGLGFRTLFGGNGAVNTKGLVRRVASLTVSLYVCWRWGEQEPEIDGWIG